MSATSKKNTALVVLAIFTFGIFVCVGSVYYGVIKNRDLIAVNNSRIDNLNTEIKNAVKEKKPVVEKVVSETEKFSGYQKEKMNFSILELKSFVEYILFNNSTADRVKFDLKSSEVVYQDTNFDNVIKTRKRLKELESDGVVKNVKNDSINLEKTIYYTTKFGFDTGVVRKFLKERYKDDHTLSTYYNLVKYIPEDDTSLGDKKDTKVGTGSTSGSGILK